ncbi:MAG: hypothetical protein RL722_2488, partial [Pseudomonadota bacterium]
MTSSHDPSAPRFRRAAPPPRDDDGERGGLRHESRGDARGHDRGVHRGDPWGQGRGDPRGEDRRGPPPAQRRSAPLPVNLSEPDQACWIFLPCAAGVEPLLEAEIRRVLADLASQGVGAGVGATAGHLLHRDLNAVRGGVELRGDLVTAMALNLHSRLAQRVLWQVADAPYRDEQDLYELGYAVRWSDWITPRQTLRVDCTASRSPLRSLHFAALRIKDALCDQLRERLGERPSVDPQRPDLALVLHLTEDRAWLSVDLSGEALFKRGWREQQGEAPLKETLAAAMLAAAGWQGRAEDG